MPSPSEVLLHRRYWQRSILIPLWTQQFLLQLVGCVIFWFAITIYWGGGPKHGAGAPPNKREQAILGAFFVLYLSLLLATLGEILLYCVAALQPKGYLLSQLLKTVASVGVWTSLVLYPLVIKDPIASRMQVAIGMEAIFAWLQIPMLSSLVHAGLVWHEELRIKREAADRSAALQAAADAADASRGEVAQVQTTNERTPLLAGRLFNTSGSRSNANSRGRSFGGGSPV